MKNNNVAIIFDDLTEFFVMQSAIDDMKKSKISVDIIVPYDSGYNNLAKHTIQKIKEAGYEPLNDAPKNKTYQVLLTPYPNLDIVNRIKFVYHLRYPYSALSSKPNPVYTPEWKIDYDGIFTFNTYEQFFSAYGVKTYPLPYWKYSSFKKKTSSTDKPTLLYLPTFGHDISSIKLFNQTAIKDLKKHYHVIAKAHHATEFNSDADDSFKTLKSLCDEIYDSNTPITEVLQKADLVLSDNSGAIFEAICVGIPVALFASNLNARRLENLDTLQYQLAKQGILPYTNKPSEIFPTLQSVKKYTKKQAALRKQLFLDIKKDSVHNFTKVVQDYLNLDPKNDNYKILHDIMVKERRELKDTVHTLNQKLTAKDQEINKITSDYEKTLSDLYNSTSWKITKPLRSIKNSHKPKA